MMTFARQHDSVLYDERLSKSAQTLYSLISRRCIKTTAWKGSQADLAERLNLSDRQVRTLLRQLETYGHIHTIRGGDGQPATFHLGKTSGLKPISDRKKTSGLKISDRKKTSGLNFKLYAASIKQVKTWQNEQRALKRVNNKAYLSDGVGKGSPEGKTNGGANAWPQIAAAKFEKLIGKPPDPGFLAWNSETISDALDYLDFKLARGAKIDDRPGWLVECLRSGWHTQTKIRGFKTTKQRAAEDAAKQASVIERNRDFERQKKENDLKGITRRTIEKFNDAMRLRMLAEARRIIGEEGIIIGSNPKLENKIVSGTAFFMVHDFLLTGGAKYDIRDYELRNYLETLKEQFIDAAQVFG